MRWSFIYLLIVVATALLGLWIFYAGGASAIEIFRTDLRLLAAVESQHPVNVRAWLPGIMIVMAIGLVLGVGWMLAGGVSSLTMRLGGRRYVRCNMSATILRVAQALVKTGMGVDDSVCVGCDLIGADSKVQNEVQSIVRGVDDANTIGRMADYSSLTAQKRLAQLRFGTPVYLVAILGGGLALVFCLIVFLPILALLNDLPRAGL